MRATAGSRRTWMCYTIFNCAFAVVGRDVNVSATISVRVPRDVKKRLEELNINVSEAVRAYLLRMIEVRERLLRLDDLDREIRSRDLKIAKGTAEGLVREGRDLEP